MGGLCTTSKNAGASDIPTTKSKNETESEMKDVMIKSLKYKVES